MLPRISTHSRDMFLRIVLQSWNCVGLNFQVGPETIFYNINAKYIVIFS